jgi:hypothetical protein
VKSVWEECKEGHAEEIYNADETVPTTTWPINNVYI